MDYSEYSIKEKVQIAAIIKAIVKIVQGFECKFVQRIECRGEASVLGKIVQATMIRDFEENFLSVANMEILKLNIPPAAMDTVTLSPTVWNSIKNKDKIIDRMCKIFIEDMDKSEKTRLYVFSSQIALANVFNIKLK